MFLLFMGALREGLEGSTAITTNTQNAGDEMTSNADFATHPLTLVNSL